MTFTRVRDPVLGEEVWLATSSNGLRLRVAPRPAFRETAAAITFAYGSTDLTFADGRNIVTTPAGTAHYLEHKLFEDDELQVFQRFAQRGARVNAQTGFTRTTYHFQATSAFADNLQDLLRLVSRPHITAANVDKERGIIAQEVRMYEDSADYCTMFDLLGCLFPEHPVRYTIGGTVASIHEITADLLLHCWRAFYRCGNAALAVAGPVDPQQVLDLAEACELPAGSAPDRSARHDGGPIGSPRRERSMAVARPKVLLGCKDPTPAPDWRSRARRAAETAVVLDRLFAASSELREALHQGGSVDDSLGCGYFGERTFGVVSAGCESEDPARAVAALRRALLAEVRFDQEQLERLRRRQLGSQVRVFENVRQVAFAHAHEAIEDAPPFQALTVFDELTVDAVAERKATLLREDNLAVAVTARG